MIFYIQYTNYFCGYNLICYHLRLFSSAIICAYVEIWMRFNRKKLR